uniref:Uncharacterized protein n=1 Tax=Magallana gigas TaxID=29159 RepID=A0A8W8NZC2_MAGGI
MEDQAITKFERPLNIMFRLLSRGGQHVKAFRASKNIESLKPGKRYRLVNATFHPTMAFNFRSWETILDLTEEEKIIGTEFYSPETHFMAEATLLTNCTRL